jgi:hypothetical protein
MNWYLSRKQKESILKIIDDDKDVDIKENGSISLNILQQKLQSFVLNVGVFVTFVFLISSSLKLKKAISKYLESDSEELINLEILNWLSRIISPKDLYNDFRQMFSRCGIRDFEYKNFSDNNKKTTTFDLTESLFIEVSNFLEQSYPKQYSKLNEIYQKLKDDYDKEKKFVSQKNCNHKYKVTDESIDWIIFTCEKCERVIPCQKSNIWNSHQITEKLRVGIYQTNNKVELRQTNSEISDINTNCNFFSGNHQIFLRIGQNEDILNGESIVETFECILCRRNWHFIISRDTMEKISIDIESYVGSDIYSKILSSALFKFILHDKKLSVDSDEITLKKLELFGLYPKYLKHIKEFEKDKKTMLKIFQKYNFIT